MNLPPDSHLSNTKSYNLQDVVTMCRGNKDLVLNMVEVFIDQIPKFITALNTAFIEKNRLNIKNEVHKIKPTVHFFGAFKLEEQLLLLNEKALDALHETEVKVVVDKCNVLASEVINELKSDYNLKK
ncbi:Hpt domain-containing protein [Polaribacter sp. R77954]|uniref:Hpt domain-containing protein n=1 Tax=Polaribacter sp. R77954 TaxID=3093870 RepID=UPI0037CA1AA8